MLGLICNKCQGNICLDCGFRHSEHCKTCGANICDYCLKGGIN